MNYPQEARKIHEEIQKKIFFMLPEKWDKLCLYASVIDIPNFNESGEMFFYYYPKGILKKKPVNVYEIPEKFNIDEAQYFKYASDLYKAIKKLRNLFIANKEKAWSNITIVIENLKYKAIYGYEDLTSKDLDPEERRLVWMYKYLKIPYISLNKYEKEIIDKYGKIPQVINKVYELPLYDKSINKQLETIESMEKKLEFVTEQKIEEMEFKNTHVPKSQILNSK